MTSLQNDGYWNATAERTTFPSLAGNTTVDVAIVGAGIVGITAARLLKDSGLTVAVIEARQVGRQVTGKSTAKVTSQHNIYQVLTRKFGEPKAQRYANAQAEGVRKIISLAQVHGLDCDLEAKSAYTYTLDQDYVAQLEKEAEIAQALGLPAVLVRETTLPFEVLAAVRFDNQAQFHPTKYVAGLARTIPGDGCHVFENSRVTDWTPTTVTTGAGTVTAHHVIMATHLPLGQAGSMRRPIHTPSR
jgi:glycine/D-amino acid oxidase-like deaminating enzyme